jgi:hypothetical protein
VSDQHHRAVAGEIGPTLRKVVGAAVYALVIGIAELPDLEASLPQGWN